MPLDFDPRQYEIKQINNQSKLCTHCTQGKMKSSTYLSDS